MAANQVISQVILDDSRITQIKVNLIAGGEAEFINQVIYDASAYFAADINNKLIDIEYCLNGFSGTLSWDATADVPLISLAKDHPYYISYRYVGGLVNNAGAGKTGDILLNSAGVGSTVGNGHIILTINHRSDSPR